MPGTGESSLHRVGLERLGGTPMMKMVGHKDSSPYVIPPQLFANNRQKLCVRLQKVVSGDGSNDVDPHSHSPFYSLHVGPSQGYRLDGRW